MSDPRKESIEHQPPIINDIFCAFDDFECSMERVEALYSEIASAIFEDLIEAKLPAHPAARAYRISMLLTVANEKFAELRRTFAAIDDAGGRPRTGAAS